MDDAHARRLEHRIARQDEEIARLRSQIAALDSELKAIHGSRVWRLAAHLWRTRKQLAALRQRLRHPARAAERTLSATHTRSGSGIAASLAPLASPPPDGAPSGDLPPQRQIDIVCLAVIDWSFRRARPQQLMRQFAVRGHRVFYVNPNHTPSPTMNAYAVESLAPNLFAVQLAIQAPLDVHGAARQSIEDRQRFVTSAGAALAALRTDFQIDRAVCIVQVPTWAPAAYPCRERFDWRLLYDCMDDLETFDGFGPTAVIEERALVRRADLLVVTSQYLYDRWASENPSVALVCNGADVDHFTRQSPVAPSPGARRTVGYFGAISHWFDVELVRALAVARPDLDVVLIGLVYGANVEPLATLPNVSLLGELPYDDLPAHLERFDVCTIPFEVTPLIEATDPVKLYEYFAQGKPVVTTALPEVAQYDDLLYISSNHAAFLANVERALSETDPTLVERRMALARRSTWDVRYSEFARALASQYPPCTVVVGSAEGATAEAQTDAVRRALAYPSCTVVLLDERAGSGSDAPVDASLMERVRAVLESDAPDGLIAYLNAAFADAAECLDAHIFTVADGGPVLAILDTETRLEGAPENLAGIVGVVLDRRRLAASERLDARYETVEFALQDLAMRVYLAGGATRIASTTLPAADPAGDDRPVLRPDAAQHAARERDRHRFEHVWHVTWTAGWYRRLT